MRTSSVDYRKTKKTGELRQENQKDIQKREEEREKKKDESRWADSEVRSDYR